MCQLHQSQPSGRKESDKRFHCLLFSPTSPRTAHNLLSPRTPQASTLVFKALHKRNRRGSRAVYDSCTNLRKIGVQTRSAKRSRAAATARRYRTGPRASQARPLSSAPAPPAAPTAPPRGRPGCRLCARGAGERTQAQQPARSPPAPRRPAGRCAGGPAHGRFCALSSSGRGRCGDLQRAVASLGVALRAPSAGAAVGRLGYPLKENRSQPGGPGRRSRRV